MVNANHTISFRGNRKSWQDFVHKVKLNNRQVWEVIEPMLEKYVETHEGGTKK